MLKLIRLDTARTINQIVRLSVNKQQSKLYATGNEKDTQSSVVDQGPNHTPQTSFNS